MPDRITPQERAAIDAAVAAGAVQRIPRGVQYFDYTKSHNWKHWHGVAARKAAERRDGARLAALNRGTEAMKAQAKAKAERIRELAADGMTAAEIAGATGWTVRNVRRLAADHGVKLSRRAVAVERNRQKAVRMRQEGRLIREIAADLGLSIGGVNSLLRGARNRRE